MKTTWTIIITIVLTAIVAGSGIFYFQNRKAEKEQTELKNQISDLQRQVNNLTNQGTTTQTPSSATPTTNDETSNWKTYSNSSLKYSIKYPTDWISDTQYINDGTLFLLTEQRKTNIDAGKIVRVFDVSVKVYKSSAELPNNDSKKLSFEDWIKQEADSYGFIQRETIVVDGVNGYQGIGSGDGESYLIFVQRGAFIYQLETGDTTKPTETEQKVINSFKFL